ncbi:MAG TPA: hypothetical protein VLA34_02800 [Candidatus Krumholzibacterium sp.]|nr:hypothetical protein [Candidatus Krumholzibacterium sp.]
MNKIQKIIIGLGVLGVLTMILFPPYAVIKIPAEDGKHAFIGYHPIWSAPTSEDGYEYLTGEKFENSTEEDLSAYIIILNKVRLTFNVIILSIVTSILLYAFKTRMR